MNIQSEPFRNMNESEYFSSNQTHKWSNACSKQVRSNTYFFLYLGGFIRIFQQVRLLTKLHWLRMSCQSMISVTSLISCIMTCMQICSNVVLFYMFLNYTLSAAVMFVLLVTLPIVSYCYTTHAKYL